MNPKDLGVSSKEFYEFKKQLAALKKFRGRGTELISVYVTPKYPISEISGKLRDEYGQAGNIKSSATRNNVQAALDKVINYLKQFKETPRNGMAIFCGNVSEVDGRPDIQLYSLVPPVPLPVQFYRCESQFVLEPLLDLVETTSTYGLVVMDGKEATVALLKGKNIKVLKQIHSTAHAKTSKGGQCLHEKTLVQMASGEIKEIREVKAGERVISFNWQAHKFEEKECTNVFARSDSKAFVVKTKSPTLQVTATGEHRFFVATEKGVEEKFVEELRPGDLLMVAKNVSLITVDYSNQSVAAVAAVPIESVEKTTMNAKYYDLEVPGNENFVANGVIVHNSAARFGRLREEGIEYFHERIGEAMASFLDAKNFKGVLVGGPGPAKENFVKAKPFNYQLKILGVVDTGYTDEYGLREVLEKSQELISEQEAVQEKKLLDAFLREVARDGLATYGCKNVYDAVEKNQAKQVLVTEGIELYELKLVCTQCAKQKVVAHPAKVHEEECECGGKMKVEHVRDLLAGLIGAAEEKGITVTMVSQETAEGQQFASTFHGVAAFLKYR